MKQQPTYNPLELLRRWVQGDTRQEEERQLEQLAKEDPFLAEALEGYRRRPEGRHAERVEQLRARLRERRRERRGILFYLPRVAAAVVALALVGGGFWYVNQGGLADTSALALEEQDTVEERMEKAAPEPTVADAPSPAAESAELQPPSERQNTSGAAGEPESKPLPKRQKKTEEQERPAPPPPTEPLQIAQAEPLPAPAQARELPPAADESAAYEFDKKEKMAAEEALMEDAAGRARIAAPSAAAGAHPAGPSMRRVSGAVLDENGDPLIGVNVLLEGTNLGAVTGLDGQFQLEWPDSLSGGLIFTYVGLTSLQVDPGDKDTLEVVMDEAAPLLEEVVVTGLNVPRQEPPLPRPEKGFPHLRQYVRDSLQYPEAARREGIEGRVKLRFQIRPDGSLYDFRVEKGLNEECNEEAIRLLKEGPKWEGAGQEATYTVRFKL